MRITICRITLHESVFYSSREIGRFYETERYLHNYALTYALGFASAPYFHAEQKPAYREELDPLNARGLYVTPATPRGVGFSLNTFKYGNNNYHADSGKMKFNTPTFGRLKELAVGSEFEFAILTSDDALPCLPEWIRLGLWLGKAHVRQIFSGLAAHASGKMKRSAYPINPLDLTPAAAHAVSVYDLIVMPPVSLLDRVEMLCDGWMLIGERGEVWLPEGMAYRFEKGDQS